jgi:hypothetical protein
MPSRDAHTTTQSSGKQENIFNILCMILTNCKLKLNKIYVNNYLGKYTHCSSAVPYSKHPDDG